MGSQLGVGGSRFGCIAVAIALIGQFIAGCTVQQGPRNGTYEVGLDKAGLLGSQLATFKLQDGSAGTLRVYTPDSRGPQFSIKLEKFLKVIELGTSERMRFDRAEQLGDRTVVAITRYDRDCLRTTLLSIKGSEALNWTVNYQDCRSEPELSVDGDKLYVSYGRARFVYRAGSLSKELTPLAQPSVAAQPSSAKADSGLPAPAPKLGVNAGVVSADVKAPTAKAQVKPAARPSPARAGVPPAPPTGTKPLDFHAQEQKPVRIILD